MGTLSYPVSFAACVTGNSAALLHSSSQVLTCSQAPSNHLCSGKARSGAQACRGTSGGVALSIADGDAMAESSSSHVNQLEEE
jgi:hypothetical protein